MAGKLIVFVQAHSNRNDDKCQENFPVRLMVHQSKVATAVQGKPEDRLDDELEPIITQAMNSPWKVFIVGELPEIATAETECAAICKAALELVRRYKKL